MCKICFNNEKYVKMQSEKIKERISHYGKLYMEFGGKLFDDYHASRVLPGFMPDSKLKMLLQLKDDAELIIVISAYDILNNKVRSDLGISYDQDVLRLIDIFRSYDLFVGSIVLAQYSEDNEAARAFEEKLKKAKSDLCIMHPLPRVNEIAVSVDDDPRACYFKQVLYGKYVRMALIMKLLELSAD